MGITEKELKKALKEMRGIDVELLRKDSSFRFECDMCGKCCTSSTIDSILFKPYDIYKIAKGLNIKTEEVLDKYAEFYIGGQSGFPIIRMLSNNNGKCYFLKKAGNKALCGVNDFKPGSCSLYPLGRSVTTNKNANENKDEKEIVYFLQDVNCGFKNKQNTVDSWLGLHREYEEFVLKNEAYMFNKISKMIDLQELNLLFNSNSSMNKIISRYYNALLNLYYLNYNTDIDFKTQLIKNTEKILDSTNALAISLYLIAKNRIKNSYEIDNTILIDEANKIINKILVKDFYNKYINKIDIIEQKIINSNEKSFGGNL